VRYGPVAVLDGAAVVIDVLRAFTTLAMAAECGAGPLALVDSLDGARALQARWPGALTATDGPRRADIDLVNSPASITREVVAGRGFILKTGNGTVAALAARGAELIVCASFVNARATARWLSGFSGPITFVASGGIDAEEDIACAEYLAALLAAADGHDVDPSPYLERAAGSPARRELDRRLAAQHTGVCAGDVELSLRADVIDLALVAEPVEDYLAVTAS
jgi:2-phosphosulfolactate phosphatase